MPADLDATRLGKYRVDSTVGQGAMGVVYKGYDEDIERPVALKVLHSHLLDADMGEELAVRFRQEAKAAARCMHSNIVTVFDYGISGGAHYIVMEYIEGVDLKTLLQSGKLVEFRQAADIAIQVLSALEYAHRNGVVHRDIKPANIMVLENGQVKVADFGIARLESSDLTQAGLMLGTPSYMSPEGQRGETDARSDLFAVGIVLYEMFTGKRLGPGRQLEPATLKAELANTITDPVIADKVLQLLLTSLQADPASRYQNASEFSQQLAMIVSPGGQHIPDTGELSATVLRTPRAPASGAPIPTSLSSKSQAPTPLSPTVITQLEEALIPYVGPMAPRLVKKYADECTNINQLLDALAAHIPSAVEQTQFRTSITASELTQLGTYTHVDASARKPAEQEPNVHLSESEMENLSRLLAQHVGPLASRIIKRAQRDATDWTDLCNTLADNINSAEEKQAFLRSVSESAD